MKKSSNTRNPQKLDRKDFLEPLKRIRNHKRFYRSVFHKPLHLLRPKDFNEKIHWLILNALGENEAKLADKLLAKEYIRSLKIDGLKIPKTLSVYNNASEIKLEDLPERFVLKCNHFSGDVFICKDKKTFDLEKAKHRLDEILKRDFSSINLEYHYSYIQPKIFAEEYLDDKEHKNPVDYKFYCFNSKPESILLCSNRENQLKLNDFDLNWNELDYTTPQYRSDENFKRPKNLELMTKIASSLSAGIPFVRIDLYEINNKVYFGEFTFTPGAGIIQYYKQDALDYLGSRINLSHYKRRQHNN